MTNSALEKQLRTTREAKAISQHNRDKIMEFFEIKKQGGASFQSLHHFVKICNDLATYLGNTAFEKAEQKQLVAFFAQLQPLKVIKTKREGKHVAIVSNRKKGFAPGSLWLYKCKLKHFFAWLGCPEKMEWITRPKELNQTITENDILRPLEIKALIEATDNQKDAALIHCLFESGCRISEFLSMNYGDIEFNEKYAKTKIKGAKNGGYRNVFFVKSLPLLKAWYEQHPFPKAGKPLWISLSNSSYGHRLTGSSTNQLLKKIAKRAGIKKRIYCHLLRHSCITQRMRENYNPEIIKKMVGHSKNSDMISRVYGHLCSEDVENAILIKEGLAGNKVELIEEKKALDVVVCPRCHKQWEATRKVCDCNFILDVNLARQQAEKENHLQHHTRVLEFVVKQQEEQMKKLEARLGAIENLGKGNKKV